MKSNDYKKNVIIRKSAAVNCLIGFLMLSVFFAVAQQKPALGEPAPFKVISFGEKITFGEVERTANWTITNMQQNVMVSLSGNQINDYVFEKTGTYEIRFSDGKTHNENECNHSHFNERMTVKVTNVKMTFDFSKITFSEKIRKGSSADGIIITVPVQVAIKDNAPMKFAIPNVTIAGVGSELTARPVAPEITVSNGTQLLKYQLSGTATKEAYLMFDFVDINNNVQTYYQPHVVN